MMAAGVPIIRCHRSRSLFSCACHSSGLPLIKTLARRFPGGAPKRKPLATEASELALLLRVRLRLRHTPEPPRPRTGPPPRRMSRGGRIRLRMTPPLRDPAFPYSLVYTIPRINTPSPWTPAYAVSHPHCIHYKHHAIVSSGLAAARTAHSHSNSHSYTHNFILPPYPCATPAHAGQHDERPVRLYLNHNNATIYMLFDEPHALPEPELKSLTLAWSTTGESVVFSVNCGASAFAAVWPRQNVAGGSRLHRLRAHACSHLGKAESAHVAAGEWKPHAWCDNYFFK